MKIFGFTVLVLLTGIFGNLTAQNYELPAAVLNEQIVKHYAYTLSYNETHEQASWVAYQLTKSETLKSFERSNKFLMDPAVKTGSANDADYKNSSYDRGHLAPAADMSFSVRSMKESFYYSNMSPQLPGFNRGIWKNLEGLVRSWASEYDSIYIATGPVFAKDLPTIGMNKVSVPQYYYKVIFRFTNEGVQGIGFVLPNQSSTLELNSFSMPIDSVEKLTGIDFFYHLPDSLERLAESVICLECWSWTVGKTSSKEKVANSAQQCKARMQNGNPCQNNSNSSSGYCKIHQSKANSQKAQKRTKSVQCSGITQKGKRCKRMTLSPNGKCYQHGGN